MSAWASRAILIAAVNRTYNPGAIADVVPVIVGPQGLGKSSALKSLCPPIPEAFTDELEPGSKSKIIIEQTRNAIIAEFAELAGMQRRDIETLKAFISRTKDSSRLAWGTETTDVPRRWVGVATANPAANGILPFDETGARRWGIVELDAGKAKPHPEIRKWIADNRDQLWAEAVAKYKGADEPAELYRIPVAETQANLATKYAQHNDQATEAAHKILQAWANDPDPMAPEFRPMTEWLIAAEVLSAGDGHEQAAKMRSFMMDVARELRSAGWEKDRKTFEGRQAVCWGPPESFNPKPINQA